VKAYFERVIQRLICAHTCAFYMINQIQDN